MLNTNQPGTSRKLLVGGVVMFALALLVVTSLTDPSGAGNIFVVLLLIPAVVGGSMAMAIRLFQGRPGSSKGRTTSDAFAGDGPTDVINMSRIRVAGIGGLGFMVVALAMAWVFPRIAATLEWGLAGGLVAAVAVILYRRRSGPLSSNGPRGRAYLVTDDEEITPAV